MRKTWLVILMFLIPTLANATIVLRTSLEGRQEVPGPGDEDGSGFAIIILKEHFQQICFLLKVDEIGPATSAHIHKAPAGEAGPAVVELTPPTEGHSRDCIENVDSELINDIKENPENYYVNVHNEEFPSGAVRGQFN